MSNNVVILFSYTLVLKIVVGDQKGLLTIGLYNRSNY